MSSGEARGVGNAIGQSDVCLGMMTAPRNKTRFFTLEGVAAAVGIIIMTREKRVIRSFIVDAEGTAAFVAGSGLLGVFGSERLEIISK